MAAKRWLGWVALAVIVVINMSVLTWRSRQARESPKPVESDRQTNHEAYQKLAQSFVERAKFEKNRNPSHTMIGDLITARLWVEAMTLAEKQKEAITKVNDLVNEINYQLMLAHSTGYSGDPDAYQKYLDRSGQRSMAAYRQAVGLVRTGLLTEAQAALVLQRELAADGRVNLYSDPNIWGEQLGMTETQKQELSAIRDDAKWKGAPMVALSFSKAPDASEQYKSLAAEIKQGHGQAAWAVLTPDQKKQWTAMTAVRPVLPVPPDLPEPGEMEAQAEHARLLKLSTTFRILTDGNDPLGLSAEQKSMVTRLEDVVERGLYWLDHAGRGAKPERRGDGEAGSGGVSPRRTAFLKYAEEFARLGVLSELQEDRLSTLANAK